MIPSWEKCFFGDVANVKNGFAFKSTLYAENGIPVVRISDIKGGKVNTQGSVRVPMKEDYQAFLIEHEDVLIAMSGATTGKFGVFTGAETALQNQRVGNIRPKSLEVLNKRFMFYFLYSAKKEIERLAYGGAQPNISASKIEGLCFKLPPLNEQKRIVAKIEELFSELDKGIESLKKAKEQLALYRQAVLKQAFEGKLTNKSLKDGEFPAGWRLMSISEIGKIKGGKRLPPKHYYADFETDYIYIMAGNLKDGTVKHNYKYLHKETFDALVNYQVTGGEVYITIVGACIGDAGVIPDGIGKAILTENAAKIIDLKNVLNKYLSSWINSIDCQLQIKRKILSATLGKLALRRIGTLEIPIPDTIEEQQKIVNLIETQFSIIDQLESDINTNLKKADTLRQSILKKAFSGQLVPQDPNDEPASVLLEKIKAEKAKLKSSKKRKKGATA